VGFGVGLWLFHNIEIAVFSGFAGIAITGGPGPATRADPPVEPPVRPQPDDDLTLWIDDLATSASDLLTGGTGLNGAHMKFLVICNPRAEAPMDRFAALVPEEGAELSRLKSQGILMEAWSPGGPGRC
jgi:hypothetical protein